MFSDMTFSFLTWSTMNVSLFDLLLASEELHWRWWGWRRNNYSERCLSMYVIAVFEAFWSTTTTQIVSLWKEVSPGLKSSCLQPAAQPARSLLDRRDGSVDTVDLHGRPGVGAALTNRGDECGTVLSHSCTTCLERTFCIDFFLIFCPFFPWNGDGLLDRGQPRQMCSWKQWMPDRSSGICKGLAMWKFQKCTRATEREGRENPHSMTKL